MTNQVISILLISPWIQIGQLLIRSTLVHLLPGVSNEDLQLRRTARGRPFLLPDHLPSKARQLDFNVSHSGDFTILSAAAVRLCTGLDVMRIQLPTQKSTKKKDLMQKKVLDIF